MSRSWNIAEQTARWNIHAYQTKEHNPLCFKGLGSILQYMYTTHDIVITTKCKIGCNRSSSTHSSERHTLRLRFMVFPSKFASKQINLQTKENSECGEYYTYNMSNQIWTACYSVISKWRSWWLPALSWNLALVWKYRWCEL